jgi:hypothetical protein
MTHTTTTLDIEIKADLEGIANRSGFVAEPEVTGLYVETKWGARPTDTRTIDLLAGLPKEYRQMVCNNILNAFYEESREALEAEWKETAA